MNEFKITKLDFVFRPKKMNAIEFLAMRTQSSMETYDDTLSFYELILNNIEVELNGQWLPVREQTKSNVNFYPNGIEDDYEAIEQLVRHFIKNVLNPVFTKSNASS